MKIFTCFQILHKDIPHPSPQNFCPFIWQAEYFDSDGDYYAEVPDHKWTDLSLKIYESPAKQNATLSVNTFWENSTLTSAMIETLDLEIYLKHYRDGYYPQVPPYSEYRAVTALTFSTSRMDYYEEFLKTVLEFLKHNGGFILNLNCMGPLEFKESFLDE